MNGLTKTTERYLTERFTLAPHEGSDKTRPLADALREFVRPGDVVHVGYSDARPNGALMELARVFNDTDPGLTLVTGGLVSVQHSLVELGLVRRVITSFAGENYPVARPNPALVRAIREGRVTIENWSLWSLIARLVAGALGVSHFPVRSLRGSSMGEEAAARCEYIEVDLGSDEPTGLVRALNPDVVILQAAAADRHGNVVLAAPYGEGYWGSMAARRGAIACVERIVSTEEIRAMNTRVKIPGHVVSAVCEVPSGSHPYGLNSPDVDGVKSYVEDPAFVATILRAANERGSFREWIDEWVIGVGDHAGYLAKLGADRLQSLTMSGDPKAWLDDARESLLPDEPATPTETQVIVTARMLAERVRALKADAVLAGVGLANLAAWIGVENLRKSGVDVELMAEIGLYGYSPRPGEPFIFAGRNVPTNKMLTDVMGVLGTFVPGPGTRSIGVIGAGQIDRSGAINSTYATDGSFIVGSGGANDVLSAADEVIVTVGHKVSRLVGKVDYVTCPGERVGVIVTDLAVFERDTDGDFVLTRMLPDAGADPFAALAKVRAATGWDFPVADGVILERPPTAEELAALRVFDPDLLFLRDRRQHDQKIS